MALRSKIFFLFIAVFWFAMNYLLWQSQSAEHSRIGSAVPVAVVWNKIVTAPDNSSLDIFDHEKRIGYCQWSATSGNGVTLNQSLQEDYEPVAGPVRLPTRYTLNLDGDTTIFGTNRVRFEMRLSLSTNETWQDFHLILRMRPTVIDLHAVASLQKMMVKVTGSGATWQRVIRFSELEHPEALLTEITGTDLSGIGFLSLMPIAPSAISQAAAAVHWEAHEDWMKFGHSRVQVYRLETKFLGQPLYIFTSRVGEILWVEAPNKLTMQNEAFSHF